LSSLHEITLFLLNYLEQGPVCKIGRSVETSNITFENDKSISRNHAEIRISSSCLAIVDMGSKFGTFGMSGDEKFSSHIEYVVKNGDVVRFGALQSKVRFWQETILFCATRLEKCDKERLKRNAALIGAKMINSAESATHLVSNKFTATVKTLTAIVLNVKIITGDWLIFAETSQPIEQILPTKE
jgi:hypothetical protein